MTARLVKTLSSLEAETAKGGVQPPASRVEQILAKAKLLKGLDTDEASVLMDIEDTGLLNSLYKTAREVKEEIYGKRIVMFAPLYISNYCQNECVYCSFRASNTGLSRVKLSQEEIRQETEYLIRQGHKRILMVAGEKHGMKDLEYLIESIRSIYSVKAGHGEIRRVNVNVAPLDTEGFRALKKEGIGTYQIFQESYHRDTYSRVHPAGKKNDFDWRLGALDRAMEAGIDDIGIGVLFGLYDWKFELRALLEHSSYLDQKYGVGPHTISVPRLEPAEGTTCYSDSPWLVCDEDFRKIIAILRLAVPYTGLILSTRENAELRNHVFALGISQISAGSKTNPGGYAVSAGAEHADQFQLGDHRSLQEVVAELVSNGFVPSFCTACYRLGRTGMDFMDLAKPGEIKHHCDPNALATLQEYILDYGDKKLQSRGEKAIDEHLEEMDEIPRDTAVDLIERIKAGKRDQFC